MGIYSLLQRYQNSSYSFTKTEEYRFFFNHRDILLKYDKFSKLFEISNDDFDMMRGNIIIYAHLNKVAFEKEVKSLQNYTTKNGKKFEKVKFMADLKDRMIEAPYFNEDKTRIYIPFFSRSINMIYLKEPEKLLDYPYSELEGSYKESIIDPWDTYGAELFNSYFTRLVKVGTNGKEIAYFHYDTNSIYIVNNQGRLDSKIALFDKFIKNPVLNHMLERLKPVVDAYFADDRIGFINALFNNQFISNKMLYIIRKRSK